MSKSISNCWIKCGKVAFGFVAITRRLCHFFACYIWHCYISLLIFRKEVFWSFQRVYKLNIGNKSCLCCELLENFAICSGVLFWNLNTGTVISLKTKNFWLIGQVSDNRGNSWQMDTKRTFKNIQDIYMRTPMPKYKVAFEIAL